MAMIANSGSGLWRRRVRGLSAVRIPSPQAADLTLVASEFSSPAQAHGVLIRLLKEHGLPFEGLPHAFETIHTLPLPDRMTALHAALYLRQNSTGRS